MFPMESLFFLLSAVFTRQQEHLRVELAFSLRVTGSVVPRRSSHLHQQPFIPSQSRFYSPGEAQTPLPWADAQIIA